jgi:hypothetical protein
MDPAPDSNPDPVVFVIDLQDASKKLIFEYNFFCLLLFEGTLTSFLKDKKSKRVTNSRNQGFSYYFRMMIEGSGFRAGSGSIPLTTGSGSGRPKNMWIRIRIWIRNTAHSVADLDPVLGAFIILDPGSRMGKKIKILIS